MALDRQHELRKTLDGHSIDLKSRSTPMHRKSCEMLQSCKSVGCGLIGVSCFVLLFRSLFTRIELEVEALCMLEMSDHFKEIACLRIAFRTEHPHETLRRHLRHVGQLFETDCPVDVVAESRLSRFELAREQALHTFAKQFLPVRRVAADSS